MHAVNQGQCQQLLQTPGGNHSSACRMGFARPWKGTPREHLAFSSGGVDQGEQKAEAAWSVDPSL
jgi:hypothetical protein